MERLLEDAEKLSGVHYDISNFNDIINAIHQIQDNIGITGTTADEAAKTISGSAAAVQAAWENLLTAMADPEGNHDLSQMVQNFVDTAITSIDNMMPSIEAAIIGLGDVIEQLAPVVEEKLPQLMDDILPALTTAISTLVNVTIKVIAENMPMIIDSVKTGLSTIWDNIDGTAKAVIGTITGLWAGLKAIGILAGVASVVSAITGAGGLVSGLQTLSQTATNTVIPAIQGISAAAKVAAIEIAAAAVAVAAIVKVADELNTIRAAMSGETKNEEHFKAMSEDFRNTLTDINEMPVSIEKYEKLGETLGDIRQAREDWAKVYQETNNRISELESKTFKTADETAELKRLQAERETLDAEYQNLVLYQTRVENNLAEYSDELIAELEREQTAEQAAMDNKKAMMAGYYAEADAMAKASRESADKSTSDLFMEQLDAHMKELDHKLATHKISEQKYWEERKKWVEIYRNEESEDWWKYYDKIEDYYDKLGDKEEKALSEETKKQKQALESHFQELETEMLENGYSEEWLLKQEWAYVEALDHNSELFKEYNNKLLKEEQKINQKIDAERTKQEQDREKQLKDNLLKQFAIFEQTAIDNNYTEDWLLTQEEKYLETLDKNSELYQEYHLKISKQRKALNDKIAKEEQEAADKLQKQREDNAKKSKQSFTSMVDDFIKNAQTKIKEYQKAVDDIKSKIKSFAEKLTDSFGSMFEFTKDEKTGKVSATKTKDFLTNRIKMLEEYYNNIKKLKEKGISDTMLKELSTLSAEEGAAAAEYLLKMDDSELKRLGNIWNRYEETGEKVSGELYAKDLEEVTQELDSERNTLLKELKELVGEKLDELLQNTALADLGGKDGGLKKWIDDMNSTVNDLNAKIESTFGQGFSVTIDGKQLVGAILPNINSGLGLVTRADMRGAT